MDCTASLRPDATWRLPRFCQAGMNARRWLLTTNPSHLPAICTSQKHLNTSSLALIAPVPMSTKPKLAYFAIQGKPSLSGQSSKVIGLFYAAARAVRCHKAFSTLSSALDIPSTPEGLANVEALSPHDTKLVGWGGGVVRPNVPGSLSACQEPSSCLLQAGRSPSGWPWPLLAVSLVRAVLFVGIAPWNALCCRAKGVVAAELLLLRFQPLVRRVRLPCAYCSHLPQNARAVPSLKLPCRCPTPPQWNLSSSKSTGMNSSPTLPSSTLGRCQGKSRCRLLSCGYQRPLHGTANPLCRSAAAAIPAARNCTGMGTCTAVLDWWSLVVHAVAHHSASLAGNRCPTGGTFRAPSAFLSLLLAADA